VLNNQCNLFFHFKEKYWMPFRICC